MIDNITLYKTFAAVAECKGISEAARRLYISQPAVSAGIITLEEKLSVKLFFRTNRGITLTPEGEVLYEYVKSALSFIEAGEDKLREMTGLRSGKLRIGASDMTLRFFLLDFIGKFAHDYPEVKISVTNAPSPKTLESLRHGQIDFGVVTEPVSCGEQFAAVPVRTIHDIFVCTDKFALAKAKNVPVSELKKFPMMMLEGDTSTKSYVKSSLGDDFPEPDIELATSDLLLSFALRGIGIASIVEDFAAPAIESGKLFKIDLEKQLPPRNFLLVYPKNLPLGAAAKQMIAEVTEKCEKKATQPF